MGTCCTLPFVVRRMTLALSTHCNRRKHIKIQIFVDKCSVPVDENLISAQFPCFSEVR